MDSRGLFVTGTDTGVGKTAVSVAVLKWLVRAGLRVGVYKPVASGVSPGDRAVGDPWRLWVAAGRPLSTEAVCPQVFRAPISPPRSARAEGRCVDERLLTAGIDVWRGSCDVVVVEGAGGLFSPLAESMLNADLAAAVGLPLVIVDAGRLGGIGRTLGTCEAAAARGLRVAAVVISQVERLSGSESDPASPLGIAWDTVRDLAVRLDPLPVAMLPHGAELVEPRLDWRSLAGGFAGP